MFDIVIIDDDRTFVRTLTKYAFSNKKVAAYHTPGDFLNDLDKFSKDTTIALDNTFKGSEITGLDIIKILSIQGYTKLFLLTGQEFAPGEVPSSVNIIIKTELDRLKTILE